MAPLRRSGCFPAEPYPPQWRIEAIIRPRAIPFLMPAATSDKSRPTLSGCVQFRRRRAGVSARFGDVLSRCSHVSGACGYIPSSCFDVSARFGDMRERRFHVSAKLGDVRERRFHVSAKLGDVRERRFHVSGCFGDMIMGVSAPQGAPQPEIRPRRRPLSAGFMGRSAANMAVGGFIGCGSGKGISGQHSNRFQ